jgi:hypothetical protein
MATDLSTVRLAAQGRADSAQSAMNSLFRSGHPPAGPLEGDYAGEFMLVDLAPGLTQLVRAIAAEWMPWKGKTFRASEQAGENIFTRDSLLLTRLFWPFYRGVKEDSEPRPSPDSPQTYIAFAFRTRLAPGLTDPDRTVLKIDYDIAGNPGPSIRRVLDEVVEISPSVLLGKAHLRWWWGTWQTVAYFTLTPR